MRGPDALIVTHAVAASFSLIFGAANLVREVKGDTVHRLLGRAFLALMYFTVFSSFAIRELRPGNFSWIHGLSVFTFVTLTAGWSAARQGNHAAHGAFMVGTYGGLWGAFIGAVAVPDRLLPTAFRDHWSGMIAFTVVLLGVGLGIVRHLTRRFEAEWSSV